MNLQTCRFCHKSNLDPDAPDSVLVKYGPRHSAHLACLHQRGIALDVLRKMHPWQRAALPALELRDLGLLDAVIALETAALAATEWL